MYEKENFSVVAAGVMVASLAAISTNAAEIIRRPNDFLTYNYTNSGQFTNFYCYPNYSSISSTNSDYNGSIKSTTYLIQGRSGADSYYTLAGNTDSGAKQTALVSLSYDTAVAARRYATAYCCWTSASNSGVADSYAVDIRKSTSG